MKEQNGVIGMKAVSVDEEVMSDLVEAKDGNDLSSGDFVRVNNIFVKQEFRVGHGFARKLLGASDELKRSCIRGFLGLGKSPGFSFIN